MSNPYVGREGARGGGAGDAKDPAYTISNWCEVILLPYLPPIPSGCGRQENFEGPALAYRIERRVPSAIIEGEQVLFKHPAHGRIIQK